MNNILLTYYKDMNQVREWSQQHSSSAKDVVLYAFKGTNGRSLSSIIDVFRMMEEVEGKARSEWPILQSTGQEKHKQYVVRMLETKLFSRDTQGILHKTKKGELYKEFISKDFGKNEQWVINYIFLLDSYFEETGLYLTTRSKEIFDKLRSVLPENYIRTSLKTFISRSEQIQNFSDLIEQDLFFLLSFYDDGEFLKQYHDASDSDRDGLRSYVAANYDRQSYGCCISKKYKPGGVYNISEFKDDVLIFGTSLDILIGKKYSNYYFALTGVLNTMLRHLHFSISDVIAYLKDKDDIIEPILLKVCGVEEDTGGQEESERVITEDADKSLDQPEEKVDDTTKDGKRRLDAVFNRRKDIARKISNYTCELQQYKGCRYFTSKKTGHNYVEVHHFVPREFRNNYEYSIDVFANYITLCPHCHKMIHLAADRERIDAIRYIFNKRADRLHKCGLSVELKDLLKYYRITNP